MKSSYDQPWKLIIEKYFQKLIEFLFPEILSQIDWSIPYQFLDKELLAIEKKSVTGNKITDKLIKVFKKNGQEAWVIIHIEIQGTKQQHFSARMFEYFYKIYDKYKKPLMSLAILTDTHQHWRPDFYQQELWGCHLRFKFPIIKLIDFRGKFEDLDKNDNPIAKVILAHLIALNTHGNATLRLENKLLLVKKLYPLGYTVEDVRSLYAFIDYTLSLPPELDRVFMSNMKNYEEEIHMQYITSAERIGREDGFKLGIEQGREEGRLESARKLIQLLIEKKFGRVDSSILSKLSEATADELEHFATNILFVNKIEEIFETA